MKDLVSSVAVAAALATAGISAPVAAAGAGQSSNAFNPDVGLVLSGTVGQFSQAPAGYAVSGFPLGGESDPGTQGFAIGESELNISANIDPDWYGILTYSMAGDGTAGVENAYVQTSSLGDGLTLRAGRFFSGIGYLNEQHAHVWDFVDTALPYRALLGTQYGDDGIQLRWLAPTDLFTEIGVEAMRGDAFPAGGASNGRGTWTGFVHIGDDVGDSHSWRAGLSYLSAKSEGRETGDPANADLFTGTSKLLIADFVWKWAPHGNPYRHNFKLQAEYLQSKNDGDFTPAAGSATPYSATPSGWYVQGVYQFMPRWRVALRHDQLSADNPGVAFSGTVLDDQGHNPKRNSVMIDYSNSEFSRLRLQYNRDQSQPQTDNQWFLQYIMSLGAHGAHIF